jgi:GAF domain-containing protein
MHDATSSGAQEAEFARIMAVAVRTLTSDFDFLDLAHQLTVSTTRLLNADAAGVMLVDSHGSLQVLSASDEDTRLLEIFELQRREGPCYECWRSGVVVTAPDIFAVEQWSNFAEEARSLGFVSAVAVPLRLRIHVVGALNVFWCQPRISSQADLDAAQALADVAAVGLVQQRLDSESGLLAKQLESALNSRATVEQAKGIVAVKARVPIVEAFGILESSARDSHRSIVDLSRDVVDRTVVWRDSALRPV